MNGEPVKSNNMKYEKNNNIIINKIPSYTDNRSPSDFIFVSLNFEPNITAAASSAEKSIPQKK